MLESYCKHCEVRTFKLCWFSDMITRNTTSHILGKYQAERNDSPPPFKETVFKVIRNSKGVNLVTLLITELQSILQLRVNLHSGLSFDCAPILFHIIF